jgi:cytochrome b subunit of formate dehydrogenase
MVSVGLAPAFPSRFSFIYLVVNPVGSVLTGVTGLAFMLALHRLMTFLLLAYVLIHIYAALVFKMFTSMMTGRRKEKVTWLKTPTTSPLGLKPR